MNLANPLNATSLDGVDVSSWKLVPFVLSDRETGVIVVATQPLADLTGYRVDELVGKSVIELGLWESLAERTAVLERQPANTPQRAARLNSADGVGRDVLFGWQLVTAEGRELVGELIIDVSFVSETRARFERLSRFRGRLTEVLRESLDSGLDDSFYERVLRSAVDTIPGAQAASLSVRDSDGIYRFKAAIGFDLATLQKVKLHSGPKAPGDGDGPWLYRGYGMNENLPEETRRLYLAAGPTDKIKVSIVTQVRLEGEPVAFFNLDNLEDPDAFDEEALSMALDYAQHLAVLMQRFRFEEALWHQAHYDKLTGLPNRRLFESMLGEALSTGRAMGRRVAVCFIDIDNFKSINDTYGHTFGDQVVAAVTERVSGLLPAGATLSRWGGDELVALLPGISEDADAREIVGRLIESAAEPYQFTALSLKCTLSIGVAITPGAGTTGEELLQNADIALYRAKQGGRNTYRIVDDEMRKAAQLQAELPPAVAGGQIGLHYQPRFDMRGRLVAMEALARWNHPKHGLLLAKEFIGAAEHIGVIQKLGADLLEQAVTQARAWLDIGRHAPVVFTLSRLQLATPDVVQLVEAALQRHALPPHLLELQVSETAAVVDVPDAAAKLVQLRRLGVHLLLDGVGSGFSSLALLKQLPLDAIKIGREFVTKLRPAESGGEDLAAREVVNALVGLGRDLGVEIVAEGVETVAQYELVKGAGATQVQGYLFSNALSVEKATNLLLSLDSES